MFALPKPAAGHRRRRAVRAALAASLAFVATGVASPAALAASAEQAVKSGNAPLIGGFSARALDENGQVTPKTYFELKMKPGESFDGTILVTNAAEDFVRLRVDSVDGLTGETSGTVYANRTDPRKETSQWIEPKKAKLRMDADSQRQLGFHLHVPDDAAPGDHVGAIAFQRIIKPKEGAQFSVRQVLRVAVAIQIRVEGPADAKLELGAITLKALGGTQIPAVNLELKNTGQLLCRPALNVTLAQGGESLGTVNRQLDTILAGDTINYPLPWPKPLDPGTYDVTAATSGCGPEAKTTQSVKLEAALRGSTGAPGPDTAALSDNGGGIPWWAMLLAVLGALGVGFFFARRTGKKNDDPPAAAAAPVEPSPASPASPAAEATPAEPVPAGQAVAIEPEKAPRGEA
ncbi:MAG: DUF916 domain-containing protein [Solirubrobacteraceae bacterium]|nr:DUF916 domain-containing protein [Solirubrobacteraceae bacterium]